LESDHESALAEIKNLFQQDNRIFKNPDIKISIQRFTTMQVHYCAYLKCSPTDLDEVIEEAKIQLLKFYQMNGYSL
jgi:Fe-S cluster assembly iron-binding protein IscA